LQLFPMCVGGVDKCILWLSFAQQKSTWIPKAVEPCRMQRQWEFTEPLHLHLTTHKTTNPRTVLKMSTIVTSDVII
jgi:hypothetical protein